ncbi:HAD-IA family hydrolase [Shinella zoogloeoides]|uniref:HAD-IA family hydrolase n=1 Tax=Shinella zoogloeoides TaxID=352475 RepID=UPI00273EFDC0|nr:HAD-IA family hydrolase [Shinella zoogloeoides]WLR92594.1 HAD-IA family hydrolase [Shinella zoogloeoides]
MSSSARPLFERSFSAFLFDMDGTIINSIPATERVWSRWALKHGLDVATFLPTMHGQRGIDTIGRLGLPGVDPVAEAKEVERGEMEDVDGILPIPGAIAFLSALPAGRWGIVTSAPAALAHRRLAAAGIPLPEVIVTAEDVTKGKPAPDGYRLGAARLGFDPADCLVFEDVPAGILAGEGAGAHVVVITATHHQPIETSHPRLENYEGVSSVVDADGKLSLVQSAG